MTRIEKVYKEARDRGDVSFCIKKEDLVEYYCPGEFIHGEILIYRQQAIFSKRGTLIGCRGITCKECWENKCWKKEVSDDKT